MRHKLSTPLVFVLAIGSLAVGGTFAMAENTILEQFDYTNGTSMSGLDGGSGWLAPWDAVAGSGTLTVTEPGLTYPDLPDTPAGNKVAYDQAFSSTNSRRFFATGFSSGTFYVSFIMQNLVYDHPDPEKGDFVGGRFAGVALFAGSSEKMIIGQGSQPDGTAAAPTQIGLIHAVDNGSNLVGTVTGASDDFLPGGPSTVESLLVVRVDLDAGSGTPVANNEEVTLWINPDLSLPEDQNTPIGGGAVQSARESARRTQCLSHLRQLGIGIHAYHAARKQFPTGGKLPVSPNPFDAANAGALFGMHALILPYIEEQAISDLINWKRDVSAAVNLEVALNPVPFFGAPATSPRDSAAILYREK